MRHRELIEKVLELEDRIRKLESPTFCDWAKIDKEVKPTACIDQAYDPPLTQLDIDPDYQG